MNLLSEYIKESKKINSKIIQLNKSQTPDLEIRQFYYRDVVKEQKYDFDLYDKEQRMIGILIHIYKLQLATIKKGEYSNHHLIEGKLPFFEISIHVTRNQKEYGGYNKWIMFYTNTLPKTFEFISLYIEKRKKNLEKIYKKS